MKKPTKRTVRIDLHGLPRIDAECELQKVLDSLPPNIDKIEVIHGVGSGVLKQMVTEFYHHRIYDRVQCMGNAGQTNYYIKQSD